MRPQHHRASAMRGGECSQAVRHPTPLGTLAACANAMFLHALDYFVRRNFFVQEIKAPAPATPEKCTSTSSHVESSTAITWTPATLAVSNAIQALAAKGDSSAIAYLDSPLREAQFTSLEQWRQCPIVVKDTVWAYPDVETLSGRKTLWRVSGTKTMHTPSNAVFMTRNAAVDFAMDRSTRKARTPMSKSMRKAAQIAAAATKTAEAKGATPTRPKCGDDTRCLELMREMPQSLFAMLSSPMRARLAVSRDISTPIRIRIKSDALQGTASDAAVDAVAAGERPELRACLVPLPSPAFTPARGRGSEELHDDASRTRIACRHQTRLAARVLFQADDSEDEPVITTPSRKRMRSALESSFQTTGTSTSTSTATHATLAFKLKPKSKPCPSGWKGWVLLEEARPAAARPAAAPPVALPESTHATARVLECSERMCDFKIQTVSSSSSSSSSSSTSTVPVVPAPAPAPAPAPTTGSAPDSVFFPLSFAAAHKIEPAVDMDSWYSFVDTPLAPSPTLMLSMQPQPDDYDDINNLCMFPSRDSNGSRSSSPLYASLKAFYAGEDEDMTRFFCIDTPFY